MSLQTKAGQTQYTGVHTSKTSLQMYAIQSSFNERALVAKNR